MALDRLTENLRRRRAARHLENGPLRRFLQTPPPDFSTPIAELPLLAMDVETTGLDPRRDRILSVGFVPVDGQQITLGGAGSVLLRPDAGANDDGVGQSATVHGITDDQMSAGADARDFLDAIFTALNGRIILAHYSRIETDFLGVLCRRTYGVRPPLRAVDTLALQRRVLTGGVDMGFTADPARDELRLWNARGHYGLPRYRAHDALVDALACAELYLAQVAELGERGVISMRDLRTA